MMILIRFLHQKWKRKSGLGEIISPMLIKPYVRPLWRDQGLEKAKDPTDIKNYKKHGIMLLP